MTTRLTLEGLKSLIDREVFFRHGTLTICVLDLINGAKVVGQSNVINEANFDRIIGETIARENAVDKLWQLEGYAVKTRGA